MKNAPVVWLVATKCTPAVEEEFNKWYDGTHIPMVFESKPLKRVTRYKLAPITENDPAVLRASETEYPTYLTIYEFKDRQAFEAWYSSPQLAAARAEIKETWGDRIRMYETKWRVLYEPMKTWQR